MNTQFYKFLNQFLWIFAMTLTFLFSSCKNDKLPILGLRTFENNDTIYAKTPDFAFENQFGQLITKDSLKGKLHIANFFFTSCPTICPKTIRSMMRIADHFKGNKQLVFINFSIDFRKDTVQRLKSYYDKLNHPLDQFHLLHIPNKEKIKEISEKYMSIATEDPDAPGGFDHSGWILLSDSEFHLRSYCLGTDDKDVDRFINDIQTLLDESK